MTTITLESIAQSGKGSDKLGPMPQFSRMHGPPAMGGTCPGASTWCREHCYAIRITRQYAQSLACYTRNSGGDIPTDIPTSGEYRIHVSGDFDTAPYIRRWIAMIQSRPGVLFFAYTRSWRVARLLTALEELRALPNMQLFASTDPSIPEAIPVGWRPAPVVFSLDPDLEHGGIVCREQVGLSKNCHECGYCFRGKRGAVGFIDHKVLEALKRAGILPLKKG